MPAKYSYRPRRSFYSREYDTESTLTPKRGTIQTSTGDRVIGRLFRINLPGTEHNVLKDMAGDIFFSLYKYDPQLVPKEKLDADRLITRTMMEWLLQQPYYQMARSSTMLSLASSVAATRKIWETLLEDEMIQMLFDQMIQSEKSLGGMEGEQDQDSEQNKDQRARGTQGKQGNRSGKPEQNQRKLSDEEYEKLRQQIEKRAEQLQNSGMLKNLIANAAKQGAEEGERVEGILRDWGLESGSGQNLSVDEISKLATTNFETITYIAEIIGRVAAAAAKTLEQTKQGYVGPPTKVAMTRDLSRILPFERLKMAPSAPPLVRAMQVTKYANQGLLGWQPASEGKKSGPFAAYVDTSGSMNGDKAYVAKALAFGLARTLMNDTTRQRNFRIRSFSSTNDITQHIDQDSTLGSLFEWAEFNFNGGTDFDTPLLTAIKDLEAMKKEGSDGADMLLITDGWGALDSRTIDLWKKEARERMGTRFMFIFIGSDEEMEQAMKSAGSFVQMRNLCDLFIQIDEHEFIVNPETLASKLIESMYMPEEAKK